MKCLPIMVEIRREENCYLELPVTAYNRSVFMSPSTRILQEHAQQIECNTIMPAMYYLEDKWIGFDPYPTIGITPQELKVDSEEPFVFKTIQSLKQYHYKKNGGKTSKRTRLLYAFRI
jgi:hypothetical protein